MPIENMLRIIEFAKIGLLHILFRYYYIYILYSESSDIYYVGYTTDIERRLMEHNEISEHSFTSKHRPWQLKVLLYVGEKLEIALELERFIKRQKSRNFIERFIDENVVLSGKLAQLVRVPQLRD
jgi:putative endonuclease